MKKIITLISTLLIFSTSYSQFSGCSCEREDQKIVKENGHKYYREDAIPEHKVVEIQKVYIHDTIIKTKIVR